MKTETDYPFEFKIVPVNNGKLSELVRIDEKTFILTIPAEVGINHAVDCSERYRQDSTYRGNFR